MGGRGIGWEGGMRGRGEGKGRDDRGVVKGEGFDRGVVKGEGFVGRFKLREMRK